MPQPAVFLDSRFALFQTRYRGMFVAVMVLAATFAGFTYAENAALQVFTASFSDQHAHLWLAATPIALLGSFVVLRLVKLASDFWQRRIAVRLQDRVRSDVEREVLARLLRRDDAFFANRPPAEILNRLGGDVARVAERHFQVRKRAQAVLQFAANIYFFAVRDWRLAATAATLTLGGTLLMRYITRRVTETDRALLAADDRVKSTFADLLTMTPEIQVGNLFGSVYRIFDGTQRRRNTAAIRYGTLDGAFTAIAGASNLLTLVALFAVAAYLVSADHPAMGLALVPVILKTLPELMGNAIAFVDAGLAQQLAATSLKRLAEYDAPLAPEEERPAGGVIAPRAVSLEQVTYRYAMPDGGAQGGIVDVTVRFESGRWTAIAGGAGSGKSTLVQVLLGRLVAQSGTVRFDERPLSDLDPAEQAGLVTLMPQNAVLLDATIGENLTFGRRGDGESAADLSDEDLALLERIGVSALCRLKALDLYPRAEEVTPAVEARLLEVRRAILAAHGGAEVRPFHQGGCDPRHWVIESLLTGACDRDRAIARILGHRPIAAILASPLGRSLVERGRLLVRSTDALLGLPNYTVYGRLTQQPVSEPIWQLRQVALSSTALAAPAPADEWRLACVALTGAVGELGQPWVAPADAAAARPLLALLAGDTLVPFAENHIHPHLTWRENAAFIALSGGNRRAEQRVQQAILERITAAGLEATFTRVGLRFEGGRAGARMSGGQRQLVAIGRALLRRTPIVVLDEPTSALDPASRARVCAALRDWSRERIVITVSHDPELLKLADDVREMAAGRFLEPDPSSAPGRPRATPGE